MGNSAARMQLLLVSWGWKQVRPGQDGLQHLLLSMLGLGQARSGADQINQSTAHTGMSESLAGVQVQSGIGLQHLQVHTSAVPGVRYVGLSSCNHQ